jgi:hypothetical protein
MRPAVAREDGRPHGGLPWIEQGPPSSARRSLRLAAFRSLGSDYARGRPLHLADRGRDHRAQAALDRGAVPRGGSRFRRRSRSARSAGTGSRGHRDVHASGTDEPRRQFGDGSRVACDPRIRAQPICHVGFASDGTRFRSSHAEFRGSNGSRSQSDNRCRRSFAGRIHALFHRGSRSGRRHLDRDGFLEFTCPSGSFGPILGWCHAGLRFGIARTIGHAVAMALVDARALSRSLARRARSAALSPFRTQTDRVHALQRHWTIPVASDSCRESILTIAS